MLNVLSIIYGAIIKLRNYLYDSNLLPSYQAKLPIICVGNITVGGNGKTPVVIKIALDLISLGYKPVILSRGYGGKITGPYLLTKLNSALEVGDEPLLIAHETNCPVVISRKRVDGCKLIENDNLGNIIIMDDGYQHRSLERDLNILCFDIGSNKSMELVTSKLLLPAGRLREPLVPALERCQLVILNSRRSDFSSLASAEFLANFEGLPVYQTKLVVSHLAKIKNPGISDKLLGPVVLLSAIANPDGFEESVRSLGLSISEKFFYPDHFQFTPKEIKKIRERFPSEAILCTSKDAVKLQRLLIDFENIWELKISLKFKESSPNWLELLER